MIERPHCQDCGTPEGQPRVTWKRRKGHDKHPEMPEDQPSARRHERAIAGCPGFPSRQTGRAALLPQQTRTRRALRHFFEQQTASVNGLNYAPEAGRRQRCSVRRIGA
jgi:hypothetical protein